MSRNFMKLEAIELHNFKCFDHIKVECSKFTLLTGANSSGKSSLLMSVLGAVQTTNFPFYFSPNGSYVNMGDFGELAYGHNVNSVVRTNLSFSLQKEGQITLNSAFCEDMHTHLPKLESLNYLSSGFKLAVEHDFDKYKVSYKYDPEKDIATSKGFVDFTQGVYQLAMRSFVKNDHVNKKGGSKKQASLEKNTESFFSPAKEEDSFCLKSIKDIIEFHENAFIMRKINELCSYTNTFGKNSNYISSFRLPPERTYYQRTKTAMKVDKFGENWIDQIVEWERDGAKQYELLQDICKELELVSSIKTKHYGGGRYEMRVNPYRRLVDCALTDVGFGVSQFLPLVVADLQLGEDSTFMMSQPEIHLHPRVQAEYVSHLVKSAKNAGKRYIIETHSEYMLNRFRLLIAKGVIEPADVAIYYLSRLKGKVCTYRLSFEKDGSIRNAPKDFFETYMMDAVEIALHAQS